MSTQNYISSSKVIINKTIPHFPQWWYERKLYGSFVRILENSSTDIVEELSIKYDM